MKNTRVATIFAVLPSLIFLTGCTWKAWYGDFAVPSEKFESPAFDKISVGDSKDQVRGSLGKPDDTFVDSTGIESWEYWRYDPIPGPDRIYDRYRVVFGGGRVRSWNRGIDSINELRVR